MSHVLYSSSCVNHTKHLTGLLEFWSWVMHLWEKRGTCGIGLSSEDFVVRTSRGTAHICESLSTVTISRTTERCPLRSEGPQIAQAYAISLIWFSHIIQPWGGILQAAPLGWDVGVRREAAELWSAVHVPGCLCYGKFTGGSALPHLRQVLICVMRLLWVSYRLKMGNIMLNWFILELPSCFVGMLLVVVFRLSLFKDLGSALKSLFGFVSTYKYVQPSVPSRSS